MKWKICICYHRDSLIIVAPGPLCAWEQYFSKNDHLGCMTLLKPSFATDTSDSDRRDNDSGKELKTIKLHKQTDKFIACKSGPVSVALQLVFSTSKGVTTVQFCDLVSGIHLALPPLGAKGH